MGTIHAAPSSPFECLRRDVGPRAAAGQRTTCVLCAMPLDQLHFHLVDCVESSLGCACRACALLFANNRDSNARYRTVPSTVRFSARLSSRDAHWRAVRIPSALVFVFQQSAERRWIAILPSPDGPVRVTLPQAAWQEFMARRPLFANLTPDVEALLVRPGEQAGDLECIACPIDRCYALVGILQEQRFGSHSGRDTRARVSSIFAELRRAAEITHES
jgi:Family of unknown function (DUF5947)